MSRHVEINWLRMGFENEIHGPQAIPSDPTLELPKNQIIVNILKTRNQRYPPDQQGPRGDEQGLVSGLLCWIAWYLQRRILSTPQKAAPPRETRLGAQRPVRDPRFKCMSSLSILEPLRCRRSMNEACALILACTCESMVLC
jgi:hypothetical protein